VIGEGGGEAGEDGMDGNGWGWNGVISAISKFPTFRDK